MLTITNVNGKPVSGLSASILTAKSSKQKQAAFAGNISEFENNTNYLEVKVSL